MNQTYTAGEIAEITITVAIPGQDPVEISGLKGRVEFGMESDEEEFFSGSYESVYSRHLFLRPQEFKLTVSRLQPDENGTVFVMKIGENEYVGALADLLRRVGVS